MQHQAMLCVPKLRLHPSRCRTQRRNRFVALNDRSRIAGCSHFTRKKRKVSCFRLPPQNKPHATAMRPLQCGLQHDVANPRVSTHMATEHNNNHAAITLQYATSDSKNARNDAHTNRHPLQNTEEEPIHARNDCSHTRRTQNVPFIADCSHFTQKNTRFRAPASSPKRTPRNSHAAITVRFAASRV